MEIYYDFSDKIRLQRTMITMEKAITPAISPCLWLHKSIKYEKLDFERRPHELTRIFAGNSQSQGLK